MVFLFVFIVLENFSFVFKPPGKNGLGLLVKVIFLFVCLFKYCVPQLDLSVNHR